MMTLKGFLGSQTIIETSYSTFFRDCCTSVCSLRPLRDFFSHMGDSLWGNQQGPFLMGRSFDGMKARLTSPPLLAQPTAEDFVCLFVYGRTSNFSAIWLLNIRRSIYS
jgi:hypothetical protein